MLVYRRVSSFRVAFRKMGEYGWLWMNGGEEDSRLDLWWFMSAKCQLMPVDLGLNKLGTAHHFPVTPTGKFGLRGIPAVFNRRWSAVPGSTNVWLPVQHNWSIGWYVHGHKGDDVFLAISGLLIAHSWCFRHLLWQGTQPLCGSVWGFP